MHLAVDARWAQPPVPGGVGRGLRSCLPVLAERFDITLLTDPAAPPLLLGLPEVPLRTPPPGNAAGWLQWSAPRWLAAHTAAVFWCPWYGLPYRQPVPMAVTIHDLTFEHRPEWMRAPQRAVYRAQARHAARTAAMVVVPSRHVADDVCATYGLERARVRVVPNAADPVFRPYGAGAGPGAAGAGAGTPGGGYVVALGGARRRRLDLAVAAWQAWGGGLPLHVLGTEDPGVPGVVPLGRLGDDAWARELAGATALLYPTEYEGFGMPALEAVAAGTPVVCARVGALPEVLGDAASWADSLQPADLAAALGRVDDALRRDGLARAAAAPTWRKAAELLGDALLDAGRAGAAPRRPQRHTVPMTTPQVDALGLLTTHRPLFHAPSGDARTTSWGIAPEVLRWLQDHLRPGMHTLETGSGDSTVVFLSRVEKHTAVAPDAAEAQAIRDFCKRVGVPAGGLEFLAGRSQQVLPRLEDPAPLDVVLIDGDHAFPAPYIDWYYTADRVRRLGYVLVDDTQLRTGRTLRDFLGAEPEWRLVEQIGKTAIFQKVVDGPVTDKWWGQQPWGALPRALPGDGLAVRARHLRNAVRLRTRVRGLVNRRC